MIELSITVKDENSKLTEKEVLYDDIILSTSNAWLYERVQAAIIKFGAEPGEYPTAPDVTIKATMVWQ